MVKYSTIVGYIAIALLGWFGVQSMFGLITGGWISYTVQLLVSVILLLLVVNKYGIKSLCSNRMVPIFLIWIVYIYFFFYHANEKRSIAASLNLLDLKKYYACTIQCIVIAGLFRIKKFNIEDVLYKAFLVQSGVSLFIVLILLKNFGLGFFVMEATIFGSNVTLITLSYFLVFNGIIGIYLYSRKDLNYRKPLITGLLIYTFLLVLLLGKRGALLALFVPTLFLYFFRTLTVKRAIIYLFFLILGYFIVVNNIDLIFDLLSVFSERLANACRDAYYLGDKNGRDFLWDTALSQISRNPIYGYFPRIIDVDRYSFFYGLHPHNYYLESIMTMGIFGSVFLFAYMLYLLLAKVYFAVRSLTPYRFVALLFVSELIHGIFSSPLSDSNIWMAMFILSVYQRKPLDELR